MLIVQGKRGGILGLVTVDDILEEIVGPIFIGSRKIEYVKKIHDRLFRIDGRAPLGQINKLFDLGLPEEYYLDTVADFVKYMLQKKPVGGESIEIGNSTIMVHETTVRGIKNVNLIKND